MTEERTPQDQLKALDAPIAELCTAAVQLALDVVHGRRRPAVERQTLTDGRQAWSLELIRPFRDESADQDGAALD